jgi:integration host factor subunit alpha
VTSLETVATATAGVNQGRIARMSMAASKGRARTTTRTELLGAVHTACPNLTRAQARSIFEMTLEEIGDSFVRGESVRLRAFGTFTVRSKRERVGRNPKTGIEVPIRPRRVVTFKASPVFFEKNGELPCPNSGGRQKI